MRTAFAALALAVLAAPAAGRAEAPVAPPAAIPEERGGPAADVSPATGEADPAAVPATGSATPTAVPASGASDPSAVPAVAAPPADAASIAGPTGAIPSLPPPTAPPLAAKAGDGRHVLAFRPEVVVPFGDWAEVTGAGLGLTFGYDHRATERLTWTGRLGYVVHLENEKRPGGRHTDLHTHEVPVLAGVRYAPLPRLYGAVEAGLVHFRYESERGADVETDGGFRLGGSVGAGYRAGDLDLGVRLFLPDLVGRDDGVALSTGLALQVGYAFADL